MTWMPVLDGSVMLVTAVAAVTDLRSGKVPNWLTLPALVAGPALWGMLGGWSGLETSALGLAVGFLPLFVFYRSGAGLHGGDVKLMGAVGALRGWPFILVAILYSFIVAAVMGVVLMLWRGQTRATFRRIGRTLKSVLLPGVAVVSPTAPESIRVPFAVCVCLGTAWGLVEAALKQTLWETLRRLV